jgi:hypothetical protein
VDLLSVVDPDGGGGLLGVDVAEGRRRRERPEVEDDPGLHLADVAEAVAHVDGDHQPLLGPQRVRFAVEVDFQLTADDVHELLGVRVVVLTDAVAGLHDGHAHETAGGADRVGGEHGAQIAAAPSVGLDVAEIHDGGTGLRHGVAPFVCWGGGADQASGERRSVTSSARA